MPPTEPEPDTTNDDDTPPRQKRLPHVSVVAAILVGVLGFAITVQVTHTGTHDLDAARTEDLVRILADLDAQRTRLVGEIDELEADRDELTSGSQGHQAALDRARALADRVGILAGTLAAKGPGLDITFNADSKPISSAVFLDAIQELRGAGAEAMQIGGANGEWVRLIASSYFAQSDGSLLVDGVRLTPSQRILVIGDPDTMATALNIPGGVADTVQKDGGTVSVRKPGTVEVTALVETTDPEYAEPANLEGMFVSDSTTTALHLRARVGYPTCGRWSGSGWYYRLRSESIGRHRFCAVARSGKQSGRGGRDR